MLSIEAIFISAPRALGGDAQGFRHRGINCAGDNVRGNDWGLPGGGLHGEGEGQHVRRK